MRKANRIGSGFIVTASALLWAVVVSVSFSLPSDNALPEAGPLVKGVDSSGDASRSASWTVIKGEEILANQHGEEFAKEMPVLLQSTLTSIFAKDHVHGLLQIQDDGTTILLLQAQ
jgi:hypothetical protein